VNAARDMARNDIAYLRADMRAGLVTHGPAY